MTKLILALDTDRPGEIPHILWELRAVGIEWIKVGLQASCAFGLLAIEEICKTLRYKIFADFKFHDIPSTVRKNVELLSRYNVDMLNVHTMGGATMMREAISAAKAVKNPPLVIGVTVLTSHLISQESVVKLATNAQDAGLDGVVCSPLEVEAVRKACGNDFLIVTPGIRPLWSKTDDHARYATPIEITRLGVDYVIVGRPIMEAAKPVEAAKRILEELDGQLPETS